MARLFFLVAAALGFLGVAGGAFGAHALKGKLDAELLGTFEVGIRYQMYHAFALALAGWAMQKYPIADFKRAGLSFMVGVALFSGSLYIMTLTGLRWLGAITPVGGLAFLVGWLFLFVGFWKQR
ncbi:MAG TPA: DUF423 domain-containing protein [Bacteroidota bacterium]|nr:DUF423 domain-containing protein [Bacteroidota bacterium]